eukprot:15288949-Alexandrium_andersonii.AAC.1
MQQAGARASEPTVVSSQDSIHSFSSPVPAPAHASVDSAVPASDAVPDASPADQTARTLQCLGNCAAELTGSNQADLARAGAELAQAVAMLSAARKPPAPPVLSPPEELIQVEQQIGMLSESASQLEEQYWEACRRQKELQEQLQQH